jgi:dTMP kinase
MNYHVSFDLDFKRNEYPGKFIVLEGIDGSGKTLQSQLLADNLTNLGKKVYLTKNPTDSEIGKFIRSALQGKVEIPVVSFQYLFSADRQIQQLELIEHLKAGEIVISDRYFWSSIAYGMADKEAVDYENQAMVQAVAQSVLSMYNQFIVPDITFYLNVSVATGLSRRHDSTKEKELYENSEKMDKVEKGYKWLLQEFAKEFTIVDAQKPAEEVQLALLKTLWF